MQTETRVSYYQHLLADKTTELLAEIDNMIWNDDLPSRAYKVTIEMLKDSLNEKFDTILKDLQYGN